MSAKRHANSLDSWILVLLCVIWMTQAVPRSELKTTRWTFPSGHCDPICSCRMDGLYYSEGEKWTRKNDPCTTYGCNKNGTIKTVEKGCWYKNECKPVNTKWSESCNTFSCVDGKAVSFYRLVEAGCKTPKGDCLRVGDQIEDGCDLMECQLNDTYLAINTIQTGCSVESTCLAEGSYWHDGCTVFTCERENNLAVRNILLDDIMQWPDGNYGLLKPEAGCPHDVPFLWSEGSQAHYSTGRNYFSNPLLLSGNYTSEFMRHEFCVHGTSHQTTSIKYKTYWEPGSYCILRRKGKCPRGFSYGYVLFDDKDKTGQATSTISGDLPDGDYGPDTGIYFCCRKDGNVYTPIVLPIENDFVLFMNKGETICQAVKGMIQTVRFFTFSGGSAAKHEQRGLTPSVRIANDDVTVYLCHYSRMECGCTDKSGIFIDSHKEKEINCTLKRCVSEKGKNRLEIVIGGCSVNGTCRKEGTTWAEFQGDSCIKKTCTRVVKGVLISFEVKDSAPGCRNGNLCEDLGVEIIRECQTSQCMFDTDTNKTMFKLVKADCPWLDTCKAPNSTWEHECMMYQCDMKKNSGQYIWNVPIVGYACEWNHKCYAHDDVWSDGCMDYKCIVNRQNGRFVWSVVVTKLGCKSFNGSCLSLKDEISRNCITYKCSEMPGKRVGFDIVSTGCEWNRTCMPENSQWNDTAKCIEYQCLKTKKGQSIVMHVDIVRYGCLFNNTCVDVNSTWSDGCKIRKCVVERKGRLIERSIAPVSTGCDDEGICRDVGYIKKTIDCKEYRCTFNETIKDAFFTLYDGECPASDGTCQPVGSQWVEKRTRSCIVYECRRTVLGFLSKAIEQKCKDANDNCVPLGTVGFPAYMGGVLYNNCSCVQFGDNNQFATIRC